MVFFVKRGTFALWARLRSKQETSPPGSLYKSDNHPQKQAFFPCFRRFSTKTARYGMTLIAVCIIVVV